MSYLILGGGGVVGEFYLPALSALGLLDQTTVADPSEGSLGPLRAKFPQARYFAADHVSALNSLGSEGDERVIVALPNFLHVDAVEAAIAKGRHVLCEKPLALRAADCERLAGLAEAAGVKLKVAMSRRYLASLMLARQMARGGEFGKILAVEVQDCAPFLWKPRSFAFFARESGGVLADMGVHYLDFLDTLVGLLKPVAYEDDARGGTESRALFGLKAGPIPVSLKLSRLDPAGAFVRIVCERGEILVEKAVETGVKATPRGGPVRTISLEHPFENPEWPAGFHGSFCQMLADFERAIDGVETPIADGSDAVRATALIEWAYAKRPQPHLADASKPLVLVTGGTGFIGGHLVERLTGDGELRVRATVRSPTSLANLARFPVEMQPADLLDPASVREAVKGARTVYHLAYGKEAGKAASITIDGTKCVVEAAIAEGVEAVVVLSTMYVFGFPPGERAVDETFPYAPYGGEYAETKAAMEKWLLERAKTSGKTRIVLLNPTCVFGPDGGAYTTLPVELAAAGQFCWIEGGRGSANYTYVENVVDAVIAAAAAPEAHGERFIITDGVTDWRGFLGPLVEPLGEAYRSYTLRELAELPRFGGPFSFKAVFSAMVGSPAVRVAAKRSALVRRYFEWMNQRAAAQGQAEHALTFRETKIEEPTFPPIWVGELYGPARATFTSAKAERVLGWKPRISFEEAQGRTLDWLLKTGRLPS